MLTLTLRLLGLCCLCNFHFLFANDPSLEAYEVLGIGSSCVDTLVLIDDLFLSQYPLIRKGISQKIDLEEFQSILRTTSAMPKIVPGGSAANTIRGLAKLGVKCAFLSNRGDDSLGELFAQNLRKLDIVDLGVITPRHPTTRALCLITPDGQKTVGWFNKECANPSLHANYFNNVALVHTAAHLLANGSYLEQVMEKASKEQSLISITLSNIEVVIQYKHKLLNLLDRFADVVFANEEEIQALMDLPPVEGCLKLQQICPLVVMTQGRAGCTIGTQNKLIGSPAFPAVVVDTTGAGDLFASGFLFGLLKGYPLEKCAEMGNFLGSVMVETIGSQLSEEKWTQIRGKIKLTHNINAFIREARVLF